MIWLVMKDESHQIVSCNVFEDEDKHQVWVTRPGGKNLKVYENKEKSEVLLFKEALDYAIKTGEKTFTIN